MKKCIKDNYQTDKNYNYQYINIFIIFITVSFYCSHVRFFSNYTKKAFLSSYIFSNFRTFVYGVAVLCVWCCSFVYMVLQFCVYGVAVCLIPFESIITSHVYMFILVYCKNRTIGKLYIVYLNLKV